MNELDKKICIVSSGLVIPDEITVEALEELFSQAKNLNDKGDVPATHLRELLLRHLGEISEAARIKRHQINFVAQSGYWWELKATGFLFLEACSLFEEISDQCAVSEFKEKVKAAYLEKDSQWGWGFNWSDSIQAFVLKQLKQEIEKFTGPIVEGER